MTSNLDTKTLNSLFDFDVETLQTLKDTFGAVKDKTWVSSQRDAFQINSTKAFSSALGECMGEALYGGHSHLSLKTSTDSELAKEACTIMKKKLGP